MNTSNEWMIYGANGYTGEMIAREAVARGLRPTLAGRSREKLAPLAQELGLPLRVFDLGSVHEAAEQLKGMKLVLLTAGPFSATSAPMIQACLKAGAHYLDITGEIAVFEHAFTRHEAARAAGVLLCPGVGFDVIPTDCVALALKEVLPDATDLSLAFYTASGISPGTLKTTIESAALGGCVRRGGKLVREPVASSVRQIEFDPSQGLSRLGMSAPWGDVATAFYTTGIPNITVYLPASRIMATGARMMAPMQGVMAWPAVQKLAFKAIETFVKGPGEQARERTPSHVWGEAINAQGQKRTARLRTANGYSLTITGSLGVVTHLLSHVPEPGTCTPARLMGSGFVSTLPQSGPIEIT